MNQYPHIGIFGGSGSGKSFGMRVILEEIMKLNIPTVVLDPHYEMDFSKKAIFTLSIPSILMISFYACR
ncbi:helicase HerA domain-containing protein [Caloramator sp. Dgby_cultured_2]|uniref:helicase HerA domain-containing protein n=1 Tax=Caloramator sp. Dgby_cultured_2 TaxID=3029174 RepID=UPI00237DBD4F|nr:DUF87 domain-containing protein [Caloramator sp. Dgby_cultured_2]WDU82706.1 DUF87 domain-containing protein [Caloramator sp. Dgby_cultured_2]